MLVDQAGAILAVHPPMDDAPAKLTDILGEAQPLMLFADRAGVMTIKLPGGDEGMATVRSLPASSGQIAARAADAAYSVRLVDAHHRPRLAARRHDRGAARHRRRLRDAGEPRARRRRGLREGARPDRLRAQPRTLRPVGLGYRPRAHLLVRFHVRAARLRAPGRVPVLRRSERHDPSRGSGSLHPRRAARLRQHLARRLRVPHPQHHAATGCGCAPAPS